MSSYGPPAGGYPPPEPWQNPPTDPWGGHPTGPGYPPGPMYQPGPEPSWAQPAVPPPPSGNSRRTVLIVVVAVLALLLGVGGFTAFFLANRDKPQATPGPSATPAEATTPAASTGDFRTVAKGQCVVNDGTEQDPKIRIVPCAKDTLLVLDRVNGTVDTNKCATVKDYQFFFFYNSTLDSLDFVLCMKKSS